MQVAIGYLRVSTGEQRRRGFSLETPRRDIGAFWRTRSVQPTRRGSERGRCY
jgi:hypothetical protein